MALLRILLIVIFSISVVHFLKLAIQSGVFEKKSADSLDLDTFPEKTKEKEALPREDPEDLIV